MRRLELVLVSSSSLNSSEVRLLSEKECRDSSTEAGQMGASLIFLGSAAKPSAIRAALASGVCPGVQKNGILSLDA